MTGVEQPPPAGGEVLGDTYTRAGIIYVVKDEGEWSTYMSSRKRGFTIKVPAGHFLWLAVFPHHWALQPSVDAVINAMVTDGGYTTAQAYWHPDFEPFTAVLRNPFQVSENEDGISDHRYTISFDKTIIFSPTSQDSEDERHVTYVKEATEMKAGDQNDGYTGRYSAAAYKIIPIKFDF